MSLLGALGHFLAPLALLCHKRDPGRLAIICAPLWSMSCGPPAFPELAAEMARLGKTGAELAKDWGIAPATPSAIVRGLYMPSMALRRRIAEYFDASVDVLFAPHPEIQRLIDSRVEQGLPAHVEDPATWRKVITLLRSGGAGRQPTTIDDASTVVKWKDPPPRLRTGGRKKAAS